MKSRLLKIARFILVGVLWCARAWWRFIRFLLYPLVVLGSLFLKVAILPLYQLYHRIKSGSAGATTIRFRTIRFRSALIHHTTFLLFSIGTMFIIVNNITSHQLYAEEMGLATPLYELTQGSFEIVVDATPYRRTQTFPSESLSDLFAFTPLGEDDEDQMQTVDREGTFLLSPVPPGGVFRTRESIETYTVQVGDTLSRIAGYFGITINTIVWANDLSLDSVLRPGKQLVILPISGIQYVVKKGDTVGSLAKRYRISEEDIRQINKLTESSVLARGETIILPGARPASVGVSPRLVSVPGVGTFLPKRISKSGYIWPSPGRRLNQYFSWRHPGIDIDNNTANDPVYAAESGVVLQAGWNYGGYGLRVLLQHAGNQQTNYAHLKKLFVKPGDKVAKGDVIGLMGSTGRSTGTHLHFEIIIGGRKVNPLSYLQ